MMREREREDQAKAYCDQWKTTVLSTTYNGEATLKNSNNTMALLVQNGDTGEVYCVSNISPFIVLAVFN